MMKKFPVTSVDGNEYLAEVYYDEYIIGKVLVVKLFVEEEYKFFWKTKTKFTKVYDVYFDTDEAEYHNVVVAVKNSVHSYELKSKKRIEQKLSYENLLERSEKELEEWNGEC